MQCTRCGADVEAQYRFCPQCGLRMSDGRDGQPLAGERKLVTVLFCDLIGSTQIAERMDPEEYSDLLELYIHRAFAEVYRFDGYVNQLAGDGFMALFGAPVAHEDAPERGVRAALAVQRAIADLAARRTPVRARIGIHTGPVVVGTVGTDRRMDYTAIGDTTNLAARLESMAQPGAILMSEATQRLVRGRFTVRETGPLTVRGKSDPVTAYEVLGEAGESGIVERATSRGLTPFVGRQRELGELTSYFARAAARERHVVAVVGDAGSGKSRLVYEFRRRFDSEPVTVLEGRCASLNQTTPFYPFVSMFRRRFGILPTDTVAEASARMGEKGEHWDPCDPVHRMLVQFLVDPTSAPPPEVSADDIKRAVFDVVEHALHEIVAVEPVVVIVEDLHHVDEVSRELLEHLVRQLDGQRALFLVTHRPADDPLWQPRTAVVPILLRRLADDDIVAVMRGAAEATLPADLERRLMRRAAGSPFFAEELVRALLENGALQIADGAAALAGPIESLPIPDTVQEVIAARLDRLPAPVKRVAQVASVLGREFGGRQLAQVLDGENIDVDSALNELERRGLVHRKGVLALDVMRFGESLTQEIAYESLLLKQRRLLHERVATILEGGSPETAQSGLLAYHYTRSDNRPKAVVASLQAAAAAERVPSYHVAVKLYREARALAEAELAVQPTAEMEQALYTALGALCRFLAMFGYGDAHEGEMLARQARELSTRLGDVEGGTVLKYFESVIVTMQGRENFARGLAQAEEVFAIATQQGRSLATQLTVGRGLCFTYIVDGRVELARRTIDWIVDENARRDPPDRPSDFQMAARWLRSVVQYIGDDLDGSVVTARAAYESAVRFENRTVQCVASSTLAQVLLLQGQFAEAQRWADLGLSIAERIGNVPALTASASVAVVARVQQGIAVDAAPYLDQIEQGLVATGPAQINFRFVAMAFLLGGADLARSERVVRRIYDFAGGRLREAIASVGLADVIGRRVGFGAPEVERLYQDAAARAEAVGVRSVAAEAALGLAQVGLARGDFALAQRHAAHAGGVVATLGLAGLADRLSRVRDAVAIAQPSA